MKQDIEKQGFKLGGLPFVSWRRGQGSDDKVLQGTIMKLEQYRSAMRLASSEIGYRNRVIRTLTTFNYQASRQTKTTAVLQLALSQALKTARSEVGAIILIDPETKNLTMGVHQGLTPEMVRILTGRQYDESAAVLMPHLVAGKGALLELGSGSNINENALLAAADVSSLVSLPVQSGYDLVGALLVGTHTQRKFTAADVHCLIAIAQGTAVALESLNLREKLWATAESLLDWEEESDELGPTGFTSPLLLAPLKVKFGEIVTKLGGSMGAIFILEDDEEELIHMVADYGLSPLFTGKYGRFYPKDNIFPFTQLSNRNLLVDDLSSAKAAKDIPLLVSLEEEGARSVLASLMDKGDHPDIVVVIAVNESGDLTPDDIDDALREIRRLMPYLTDVPLAPVTLPIASTAALDKTLTSGASDADLERVLTAMISAEEESERYSADFAALNAIGEMLLRLQDDPALILYELIVKIRETIPAKAVWLYLRDGDELEMRARVGLSREFVEGRTLLAWGVGIEGEAAKAGEGVFIEDMELVDASDVERELGAMAVLPLLGIGGVVGVLAVGMDSPTRWLPRQVRLLTTISQQVGMAVENGRLSQQIQSSTESLADNNQALYEIRQLLDVG